MSDSYEGKIERRCTKENPCDLLKVDLKKEHWIHEDVDDLFPDLEYTVFKCRNCGVEIEVDLS